MMRGIGVVFLYFSRFVRAYELLEAYDNLGKALHLANGKSHIRFNNPSTNTLGIS